MFCDKLNEYIGIVGCTGRELAELFCISAPTINRYAVPNWLLYSFA